MKTQDHMTALYSKPSDRSRNVGAVSNPEDRQAFDDLFEDPDQGARADSTHKTSDSTSTPLPGSAPAAPVEQEWDDQFALPDFLTHSAAGASAQPSPASFGPPDDLRPLVEEPAPVEMRNVNVIGPARTASSVQEPVVDVAAPNNDGPEFVAPMEEFNSGFMTPVPITAEPAPGSAGTQQSGRLYRSSGAEGPAAETAIPAMDSGLVRISTDPTAQPAAAYRSATSQSPDAPDRSGSTFAAAAAGLTAEEPSDSVEAPAASARRSFRVSAQPTGLTYNGAAVVILAATIVVGFIDAILNHKLGWLTGVALVASAVYAALNVRIADAWAPAILAPLGFMAATLTAGQLTRGSSGSWFIREGYMIFRSLAVNAPWIIGATVICAGIAFWRKRSA